MGNRAYNVPSLEGDGWLKSDGNFGKFDSKEREVQLSRNVLRGKERGGGHRLAGHL